MTKKISIFYILLCINLCCITILSAFNYFVFHSMNSKAYLESFIDYNKRVTDLAFRNIDKQIMESLVDIPQLYFSDIKLNEPVLRPQKESISENPSDITALVGKLEEIQKAYPHVVSLDIYYEGTKTIVTGYNRVHFASDEKEVNQYLPWYFEFEKMGMNQYFFGLSNAVYPTREPVLTYVKKISGLKWKGQNIVAAFHISPNLFRDYIDEAKGIFVLADKDGRVLYESGLNTKENTAAVVKKLKVVNGSGKGEKRADGQGKEEDQEESNSQNEPVQMRANGEPLTVFHNYYEVTGLNYIYYLPDHTFLADYNVKNQIFFLNFGVSVLFNILVLAAISYMNYFIYRKRVLVVSKEAGITIDEDNKSFDRSLSALTETITDLNETVKTSEPVLYQNSLRLLILNRKGDGVYDTLLGDSPFHRVCCFIAYLKEGERENLSVQDLQREFDALDGISGKVFFTTLEQGELAAILVFDGEGEEGVVVQNVFAKALQPLLHLECLVCGAALSLNLANLRESFLSASNGARYRFIYPGEPVLFWEKLNIKDRKSHGSHLKLFAAMEKDINNENILDFKFHIEALGASFQTGNYTVDYCMSTLRDLVTLLYQTIQRYQLDMWIIYGYDIREYYKRLSDIEVFVDWLNRVCEVLLQNIRQKKRPEDGDLKGRLEKMIEEQLESDITLDYLSDCFSMRPDVLSRTFRQLMGKGYTEYIKEKKLKRAMELIEQELTMKEIALRLGYSSPQYFIKVFREAYGITPYQYKKKQRSGEETEKEI